MSFIKRQFDFGSYDFITVKTDQHTDILSNTGGSIHVSGVHIELEDMDGYTAVWLTADTAAVEQIKIRWNKPLPKQAKILGDAWERGYGDLEWRGISADRFMPWYFLAADEEMCRGYGVRTRPNAMCYWEADTKGISLVLDVRCGGSGVRLHGRRLKAAELVFMEQEKVEQDGICTFRFAQDFCRLMCPDPIFPDAPVYGSNNWYYAYGDSCEADILKDTDYIIALTEGASNAPYMVIDDGWQERHRLDEYNGGPWRRGNARFPDMKSLAEKIRQKGAHPGIWVRLLLNTDEAVKDEWRIPFNGCLDPSHPDALEYIKQDVRCICEWGYQLIKHDFSTYDLFGRWGFEMNPLVTGAGWHFYDQSRTSAEIVKELYRAIYDIAGESGVLVLGCNTIGHLGAGLMQINRTGDDTSGRTWERTRRMGVNTLAFRLPQHRTFYDVDADCVGITGRIPWSLNRQWADVIAQSGTPLFISAEPGVLNSQETEELKSILQKAAVQACHKIPADWEITGCPEIWTDEQKQDQAEYDWYEPAGPDLQGNHIKYYANIPLQ